MKERLQGLVAGILVGSLGFGGTVYAISATRNISVTYDNIKVYKDNVLCELKDANGSTVEPFIYNGTTYMPVRATANLADMDVTWDGATKSVYLWDEMSSSEANLMEVCPPYEINYAVQYPSTIYDYFEMGGEKYADGFTSYVGGAYALFNLNGKYSNLTCTIGHSRDSAASRQVSFIVDGQTVKTFTIPKDSLPLEVSVPLNYGSQLKISFDSDVGIGNLTVK